MTDGDLWQTFADAITLRGAHSVKLSWTKGHSSWQRVAASVANPENAYALSNVVGNSIADAAADRGHEAVGIEDVQRVLDFHATKLKAFAKLIERLQKYAAALLLHDRECHREAGIGTKSKNLVTLLHAPPVTARRSFYDGVSLSLHPLPPDMTESHRGLHIFWDCTRWDFSSETSRPTTWIELFALYRLWGGGDQEEDPHARKPRFAALIKSFVQQSKHLLRTCGNGGSELLTSAYRGKTCLLEAYGICMHAPAIKAEICLNQESGDKVHNMLLCIRAVKQGPESGKLKASAAPLPRLEPWRALITHSSQPIPLILNNRRLREHDNIQGRGENGSGRDLKPEVVNLICPHCRKQQNCAKNKLFTTVAVSLSCRNCKTNTTSTQWRCTHGLKWQSCKTHREAGMRCGSHRTQGTPKRPDPLKAAARLFQKAKKLGPLGSCPASSPGSSSSRIPPLSHPAKPIERPNSTESPGNIFNQQKK